MNNLEKFNQNILNQITSEIVVLNEDLKVIWINDSAITNNWKISDDHSSIKFSIFLSNQRRIKTTNRGLCRYRKYNN
jgi:c-di-AMP phosphodiesterase-like protein